MADIGHDANDLAPWFGGVLADSFANRRLGRAPVFPSEVLRDQHDLAVLVEVAPLVLAPGPHWRPEHLERARGDPYEPPQRRDLVRAITVIARKDRVLRR